MMETTEICFASAARLAHMVRTRKLSCTEVMNAFYDRIEEANPYLNAICTLIERQSACDQAQLLDHRIQAGESLGALAGLPIGVKDLVETSAIRTSMGSPLFADFIPSYDALMVSRMKAADAIIIGKTNVPEFGAGSHSFNRLFGVTRNPYDINRSAGGSSGGAAAALAAGMLPLADGSDLGGSLRNPASFCNVVGFRPSPGRVPTWPSPSPYAPLPVLGPMGRSVADVALLLSVIAGPDQRAPLSIEQNPDRFAALFRVASEGSPSGANVTKGTRIAWSRDLGFLPVESSVIDVLENAVTTLTDLGCRVSEDAPDLRGSEEVFLTLRAAAFASRFKKPLEKTPELLKDTIRWNTEVGLALSVTDIARAEERRVALFERTLRFFDDYDFLVLPAAQVSPFPVEWDWVKDIEGTHFENYLQWMQICCAITLTTLPSISVPAGFTADGLPVGLQIVAKPHADLELLRFAMAFESLRKFAQKRPQLRTDLTPPDPFVVSEQFATPHIDNSRFRGGTH